MVCSVALFLAVAAAGGAPGSRSYPEACTVPLENILLPTSSGSAFSRCTDNLAGLLKCFQTQRAATRGDAGGGSAAQDPLLNIVDILKNTVSHGDRPSRTGARYRDKEACRREEASDMVNSVFKKIIESQTDLLPDEMKRPAGAGGYAVSAQNPPQIQYAAQQTGQGAAQPQNAVFPYQQPSFIRQQPVAARPGGGYQGQNRGIAGYVPSYPQPQQGQCIARPLSSPGQAMLPGYCAPSTQPREDAGCSDTEDDSSTGSEDSEDTSRKKKTSCKQKKVAIRCICKEVNGGLKDCECNKDT